MSNFCSVARCTTTVKWRGWNLNPANSFFFAVAWISLLMTLHDFNAGADALQLVQSIVLGSAPIAGDGNLLCSVDASRYTFTIGTSANFFQSGQLQGAVIPVNNPGIFSPSAGFYPFVFNDFGGYTVDGTAVFSAASNLNVAGGFALYSASAWSISTIVIDMSTGKQIATFVLPAPSGGTSDGFLGPIYTGQNRKRAAGYVVELVSSVLNAYEIAASSSGSATVNHYSSPTATPSGIVQYSPDFVMMTSQSPTTGVTTYSVYSLPTLALTYQVSSLHAVWTSTIGIAVFGNNPSSGSASGSEFVSASPGERLTQPVTVHSQNSVSGAWESRICRVAAPSGNYPTGYFVGKYLFFHEIYYWTNASVYNTTCGSLGVLNFQINTAPVQCKGSSTIFLIQYYTPAPVGAAYGPQSCALVDMSAPGLPVLGTLPCAQGSGVSYSPQCSVFPEALVPYLLASAVASDTEFTMPTSYFFTLSNQPSYPPVVSSNLLPSSVYCGTLVLPPPFSLQVTISLVYSNGIDFNQPATALLRSDSVPEDSFHMMGFRSVASLAELNPPNWTEPFTYTEDKILNTLLLDPPSTAYLQYLICLSANISSFTYTGGCNALRKLFPFARFNNGTGGVELFSVEGAHLAIAPSACIPLMSDSYEPSAQASIKNPDGRHQGGIGTEHSTAKQHQQRMFADQTNSTPTDPMCVLPRDAHPQQIPNGNAAVSNSDDDEEEQCADRPGTMLFPQLCTDVQGFHYAPCGRSVDSVEFDNHWRFETSPWPKYLPIETCYPASFIGPTPKPITTLLSRSQSDKALASLSSCLRIAPAGYISTYCIDAVSGGSSLYCDAMVAAFANIALCMLKDDRWTSIAEEGVMGMIPPVSIVWAYLKAAAGAAGPAAALAFDTCSSYPGTMSRLLGLTDFFDNPVVSMRCTGNGTIEARPCGTAASLLPDYSYFVLPQVNETNLEENDSPSGNATAAPTIPPRLSAQCKAGFGKSFRCTTCRPIAGSTVFPTPYVLLALGAVKNLFLILFGIFIIEPILGKTFERWEQALMNFLNNVLCPVMGRTRRPNPKCVGRDAVRDAICCLVKEQRRMELALRGISFQEDGAQASASASRDNQAHQRKAQKARAASAARSKRHLDQSERLLRDPVDFSDDSVARLGPVDYASTKADEDQEDGDAVLVHFHSSDWIRFADFIILEVGSKGNWWVKDPAGYGLTYDPKGRTDDEVFTRNLRYGEMKRGLYAIFLLWRERFMTPQKGKDVVDLPGDITGGEQLQDTRVTFYMPIMETPGSDPLVGDRLREKVRAFVEGIPMEEIIFEDEYIAPRMLMAKNWQLTLESFFAIFLVVYYAAGYCGNCNSLFSVYQNFYFQFMNSGAASNLFINALLSAFIARYNRCRESVWTSPFVIFSIILAGPPMITHCIPGAIIFAPFTVVYIFATALLIKIFFKTQDYGSPTRHPCIYPFHHGGFRIAVTLLLTVFLQATFNWAAMFYQGEVAYLDTFRTEVNARSLVCSLRSTEVTLNGWLHHGSVAVVSP